MVKLYETEIVSQLYDLINQIIVVGICVLIILGMLLYTRNVLFLYVLGPFVAFLIFRTRELQQKVEEETERLSGKGTREEKTTSSIISEILWLVVSQIIICLIYIYVILYPNPVIITSGLMIGLFNVLFIIYKWPTSGWNIGILSIFAIGGYTFLK
jgi:hypothetical protein